MGRTETYRKRKGTTLIKYQEFQPLFNRLKLLNKDNIIINCAKKNNKNGYQ